jgi:hypothetical protein
MRTLIFIGTILFSFSSLLAQTAEGEMIRLKQQTSEVVLENGDQSEIPGEGPEGKSEKPGHWNFSVGTSFSYMKGYGSGMTFYTAPTYTLALNERWSLHGGVMASHYQGLNYAPPGENIFPGYYSSLAVFAAASYRMSDRLIVHGSGVKQLVSAPLTPFTPYALDHISLGATYKLGDNITIGASVNMRNGSGYGNGYYPTPFGNPMFPSTFGW